MMNIKFIIPGKISPDFVDSGIKEYIKRISRYSKVQLITIKEEKINTVNDKNISIALEKEASNILNIVKDDYLFLIDIHANELSNKELTEQLEKTLQTNGNISFVIGSSYGLSDTLRKRANFSFSLSKLTFTHYFALLILTEQIYRSFKIINNETYDK